MAPKQHPIISSSRLHLDINTNQNLFFHTFLHSLHFHFHFHFHTNSMAFPILISSPPSSLLHLSVRRKPPNYLLHRHHKSPQFYCSSSLSIPSPTTATTTPIQTMQTQFDLKTYWTTLITQINEKLDEAIPVTYPELISECMRYSALAPGAKRAPPVMCIASCELFGVPRLAAFPTACALEMVHTASLIHDDLPYMDDDLSRRGRPTNHAIYGVDMAILAGDALFPLGFHHLVSRTSPDVVPAPRILRVAAEIARAVGSTGMAAGQFLDLVEEEGEVDESVVEFVEEKKFGEMAECSAVCGGLIAGATEEEVGRLRRYGRAVGMLYQVVDDVMEAKMMRKGRGRGRGDEEKRGKSFVGVFGLERAIEKIEELREVAKRELDGLFNKYGEKVVPLYNFVDYAVDRSFVVGD